MSELVPPVEGYVVQNVSRLQARKAYVCPDCHNAIVAGESHVVAWPEGEVAERRHWHRHCWRIAVRSRRL